MKRIIITVVAFIMAIVMMSITPLQTLAYGEQTYISDITVATASSLAAAKKLLTKQGYTPVSGDVNEGNGTAVCIGYKTTKIKSEAITDLAVMNMNGGYSFEDYNNVLKEYKDTADTLVGEIYTAVTEYRANFKAGKASALLAYELLNRFYDEDFGTQNNLLGDIFASEDTTKEQISVIFMQASALAVTSIESCLAIGCADNWLDRFVNMPAEQIYTTADDDKARIIYKSFSGFQDEMKEYVAIFNASGLTVGSSEDEWTAYFNTLDEKEQAIVANYANTYDYLKATEYNGGTLYDYFMQDLKELDNADLYPLAKAMTDGQAATVPYASLGVAIQYAATSDEVLTAYTQAAKEQANVTRVSVFEGIDRSIFSADGIALTNETMRQATSSSDYSWYKGNLSKKTESIFYGIIGTAAGIAAAGIAVAAIASAKVSAIVTAAYQAAFANASFIATDITVYDWAVGTMFFNDSWALEVLDQGALEVARTAAIETGAKSVWGVISSAAKIVSAVAIAIVLITLVIYLYKEYKAYNQRKEYTDVPRIIVDQTTDAENNNKYVYYYAVKDLNGEYADLNNWKGMEWNVLYYTKDASAGNPILASAVIQKTNKASDTSYNLAVHGFGSTGAYNLNKYADHQTGVYMFVKTDVDAGLTGTTVTFGGYAIAAACGLIAGAAIMFAVNAFQSKKKKKVVEQ